MYIKRFDKDEKEKWDAFAKEKACEILRDISGKELVFLGENENESLGIFDEKWDLRFLFRGKEILVEAEAKGPLDYLNDSWFGIFDNQDLPFKYDTMHIAGRKDKSIAKIFIVVSKCGKFAFVLFKEKLRGRISKPNRSCDPEKKKKQKEFFLSTPVECGLFVFKIPIHREGRLVREWHVWKGKEHYSMLQKSIPVSIIQ